MDLKPIEEALAVLKSRLGDDDIADIKTYNAAVMALRAASTTLFGNEIEVEREIKRAQHSVLIAAGVLWLRNLRSSKRRVPKCTQIFIRNEDVHEFTSKFDVRPINGSEAAGTPFGIHIKVKKEVTK